MKNKSTIVFFLGVFCFFCVFFIQIHPILVTTSDDWKFLAFSRKAIPLITEHNPARLLPEILLPYTCLFASAVIMPVCGDFILSITIATSFSMAFFITLYSYCFYKLINSRFNIGNRIAYNLVLLFLLGHFIMFRSEPSSNPYLFGSYDLTCYYFYIIPSLLNASVVMFLISIGWNQQSESCLNSLSCTKKGLFFLAVYFCIFSNLYSSIILSSYIGIILMWKFCEKKGRHSYRQFFSSNVIGIGIIALFVISMGAESLGNNAGSFFSANRSFFLDLFETVGLFFGLLSTFNIFFLLYTFVVIILAVFLFVKCRDKELCYIRAYIKEMCLLASCSIVCILFTILISARSYPFYATKSDCLLMEFYWLLIVLSYCLTYSIVKIPQIKMLLPLVFVIMTSMTYTNQNTFLDVEGFSKNPRHSNQIIEILQTADRNRKDSVTLFVPNYEADNNWPILLGTGSYICKTLIKHGLIKRNIKVGMVPVRGQQDITSYIAPEKRDSIVPTYMNKKLE